MNKNQIFIIGVGDSGSKAVNNLSKNGYKCLAIHANQDLVNKLQCPQLNLFDNHYRQNEYPWFTESPENIKTLMEENKRVIKSFFRTY